MSDCPLVSLLDEVLDGDDPAWLRLLGLRSLYISAAAVWVLCLWQGGKKFASVLSCRCPAAWHEVFLFWTNDSEKLRIITLAVELHPTAIWTRYSNMAVWKKLTHLNTFYVPVYLSFCIFPWHTTLKLWRPPTPPCRSSCWSELQFSWNIIRMLSQLCFPSAVQWSSWWIHLWWSQVWLLRRLTYRGAHEHTIEYKHATQTLRPCLSSPAAAFTFTCHWFRGVNQSKRWKILLETCCELWCEFHHVCLFLDIGGALVSSSVT